MASLHLENLSAFGRSAVQLDVALLGLPIVVLIGSVGGCILGWIFDRVTQGKT
jgi:hypothetical protein